MVARRESKPLIRFIVSRAELENIARLLSSLPIPPKQPIDNWQTWIKVRKNTVRPNRSLCILVCLPLETGSTGFHDAWAQAGPADQRAKKKKVQGAGAICYIRKMIPP